MKASLGFPLFSKVKNKTLGVLLGVQNISTNLGFRNAANLRDKIGEVGSCEEEAIDRAAAIVPVRQRRLLLAGPRALAGVGDFRERLPCRRFPPAPEHLSCSLG